jgi:ATP-dependent exoDNAse (exonuclease V) alpha subunit
LQKTADISVALPKNTTVSIKKTVDNNVVKGINLTENIENLSKDNAAMGNNIEINDEFKQAYDLIDKSSDCVFITGNAGTGKTTFLRYYIMHTSKKTVILAPTGVAALNCGGETVHSFFYFKPDVTVSKIKQKKFSEKSIYKKVETIIIDEASMLRCDILDCIDKFLRLNREKHQEPFGGVQMVFIGDLKQLPPVVKREEYHIFNSVYESPYFSSAHSLNKCILHTVELKKIYRQRDSNFVALLNMVRNGTANDDEIAELNKKVSSQIFDRPMTVYLTTTNKKAAFINHKYLSKIEYKQVIFTAETENIEENSKVFPAEHELVVKKNAQIMMLNNDAKKRWVNGSIGIVEDIKNVGDSDKLSICVRFPNGRVESVEPHKWELFKYKWNEEKEQIETKSMGFFKQYPLRLSWAITIHKSQGKTFDNVIIDMEYGAFVPGQLYVALSRCTSFDGITLSRPLTKRDILVPAVRY